MKRLLKVLLLLAFTATLFAQKETKQEQITRLYAEADTYLSEGEFNKARLPLAQLIKLDKANRSNLYLALGGISEQHQETDIAISFYKKAIAADKKSHKAYYCLGSIYYNQAVEIFNQLENNPIYIAAQFDAEVSQGLELMKKALPYLEKGFQLNGDKEVYQAPVDAIQQYLKSDKTSND